jgi:energy-coupling factor transporter ATP-binding protein EcfA2
VKDFAEKLSLSLDPRLAAQPILEEKRSETEQLLTALSWKARLHGDFPPIVCLVGGTGTGKSTLFNSLAECKISEVGIRRPSTLQAVILVSQLFADQLKGSPFLSYYGESHAIVFQDEHPGLEGLVLVDTPDFDSVELSNRAIADDFFIISDVLVFITSQEKYADLTGHQMQARARQWGKKTIFVMNKVASETAYNDFANLIHTLGYEVEPIAIERVDPSPDFIPELRNRPAFKELFTGTSGSAGKEIRLEELGRLREHALASLKELTSSLQSQVQRIAAVNSEINRILAEVGQAMEAQLDAIVSDDLEAQIRTRLQRLLRKYDILFVPRMMIRHAVRSLFSAVAEIFVPRGLGPASQVDEKDIRAEDFEATKAVVRLQPLEWATARLNLAIAEMLSSNPALDDLCQVARADVQRWSSEDIQARYDAAFPGMEHLLEAEFNRFRNGLSRTDEFKLYGSYTLWALFLITAEIVVGGGISLLDALLNTVIVPFIPKWLLNLKVLDVLREIGERVDREHRNTLKQILREQAELYTEQFSSLVPGETILQGLRSLEKELASRGGALLASENQDLC